MQHTAAIAGYNLRGSMPKAYPSADIGSKEDSSMRIFLPSSSLQVEAIR
jgi:hypothetical protein